MSLFNAIVSSMESAVERRDLTPTISLAGGRFGREASMVRMSRHLKKGTFASCIGTLVGITIAAASPTSWAAGRVYYNNFESGGSIGKCAVGGTAKDGGRPYSGGGMAICNWDGVRKAANWADPLADVTFDVDFSYSNEFLIRLKQRADQDYDSGSWGAKWFRFGDASTVQLEDVSMHTTFFKDSRGANISYNSWPHAPADAVYSRKWHEYKLYFRKGANGRIIIWIDGAVAAEYSGDTGDGSQSPLHVGSNWSVNPGWEHDANNHRYIDELEIYSDAGSGASGSLESGLASSAGGNSGSAPPPPPPNTSPLAAPSNLRVVP